MPSRANVQQQQHNRRSSSANRMSRPDNSSMSSPKVPTRPKLVSYHNGSNLQMAKKDSEVDMEDGIVDMEAFSQILALDETDSTQEFSKALVWAWCDQAEHSVEEMELFLVKGDVTSLANKAHYLKGSSASLGLINVSRTCQSLYHIHFPPALAHFRSYSYQSDYTSSSMASSSSSSDSDSSGTTTTQANYSPKTTDISPSQSPDLALAPAIPLDFEANKVATAQTMLNKLKTEIKEASEWLYLYYSHSDDYAARSP